MNIFTRQEGKIVPDPHGSWASGRIGRSGWRGQQRKFKILANLLSAFTFRPREAFQSFLYIHHSPYCPYPSLRTMVSVILFFFSRHSSPPTLSTLSSPPFLFVFFFFFFRRLRCSFWIYILFSESRPTQSSYSEFPATGARTHLASLALSFLGTFYSVPRNSGPPVLSVLTHSVHGP